MLFIMKYFVLIMLTKYCNCVFAENNDYLAVEHAYSEQKLKRQSESRDFRVEIADFDSINVVKFQMKPTPLTTTIKIDTAQPIHETTPEYVSVAIDTGLIARKWKHFNSSSVKLQTLAKSLHPCIFRFGGTAADLLFFNETEMRLGVLLPDDDEDAQVSWYKVTKNFTMTHEDWDKIMTFNDAVGWKFLFDFNVLRRQNGSWDPDNARTLLQYSAQKGYKVSGWELGNEPDAFRHVFGRNVSGTQLAKDIVTLRALLSEFPAYNDSFIVGPDITGGGLSKKRKQAFLSDYLKGASSVLNAVTVHHYYMNGRTATIQDFMDPKILANLERMLTTVNNISSKTAPGRPIWLGETSSAYGGGSPGLSDAYVAGFMWMDKLGLSATLGVDVVVRQDFHGGSYALVDAITYDPLPDYWLTLLYKKLVGTKVFQTSSLDASGRVRAYTHCTNSNVAKPGALTVYIMNLHEASVEVTIPALLDRELQIYLMEPTGHKGLKSRSVKLNGKTLEMVNNNTLPDLLPRKQQKQPITLPGQTYAFIVIPTARAPGCL